MSVERVSKTIAIILTKPLRSDVDNEDDEDEDDLVKRDNLIPAEFAVKSECVLSILPSVPQAMTSIRAVASILPNTEDPVASESVGPSFSPFDITNQCAFYQQLRGRPALSPSLSHKNLVICSPRTVLSPPSLVSFTASCSLPHRAALRLSNRPTRATLNRTLMFCFSSLLFSSFFFTSHLSSTFGCGYTHRVLFL